MVDLDNELGFWLKGIPYILWMTGNELKDCYRYYLFPTNDLNIYIYKNRISEPLIDVRKEFKYIEYITNDLIYTPFPIKNNTKYHILINLFAIFIYDFEIRLDGLYFYDKFIPFENYNGIRIEGVPVKKLEIPQFLENKLLITNPTTNYKKNVFISMI
jgi:hypothetical protein